MTEKSKEALQNQVAELKKEVRVLKQNEQKFRSLAENAQVMICRIALPSGEYEYANPSSFQIIGYTPKALYKNPKIIFDIIHPDWESYLIRHWENLLKGIVAPFYEYKIIHKSGKERWLYQRNNGIKDQAGKLIAIEGIISDITERRNYEQDILRLATVIDQAVQTVVVTDVEGNIEYVNPAFEKITGYSSTEVVGQNQSFLKSGEQSDEFIKKLWETILSGETWHGIFSNKKKDGTIYHERAAIFPIKNKQDEITNFAAVKQDITNERVLEHQLLQASKMESIGTLAGGIAHDFNNILFPIMGHTEMMLLDVPENSSFSDRLNKIYAGALRAKDLVTQILTFSRQGTKELELVKIQPLVKEALKLIRSTIPTTINIVQDIDADCGKIKAEPTQIHQIVMNLTINAYHAMNENGGELKINLKEVEIREANLSKPDMKPGNYVCLAVADTGIGMDKQLRDNIFDPFFSTKETGQGRGMGLSVVHGIVTHMGGFIQVFSKPGKGTKFLVYLPMEKQPLGDKKIGSHPDFKGGDEHILFIDDDEAILSIEEQMLEHLGYKVTSHISSTEALKAFNRTPDKFDLVITDMQMPDMSGDKLSAELFQVRPDIPIVLCTGFSELISEEKALSLGMKGFLLKPIKIKNLSEKIREVLDVY